MPKKSADQKTTSGKKKGLALPRAERKTAFERRYHPPYLLGETSIKR